MIHLTTHNVSVWPPYPFPSLVNLHHLQRKVPGILTAFKLCVFPLSWIRISCSEMRVCSAMCKTDQNRGHLTHSRTTLNPSSQLSQQDGSLAANSGDSLINQHNLLAFIPTLPSSTPPLMLCSLRSLSPK